MTRRTGSAPIRIAFIGQKGIPARYGGVETHVENVAVRLASRGHDVTVYCRSRYRGAGDARIEHDASGAARYRGVRLVHRPSVNTKHLDAATHTAVCAFECAVRRHVDVVHFHGIGPAAFAGIPAASRIPVVSTFHALDWRQAKWGARASHLIRRGERAGARYSTALVAVSQIMREHIDKLYGRRSEWIPNGATVPPPECKGDLARWGLEPGYVLTVGRIIPDREIDTLIRAFVSLPGSRRLVIVGSETPRTGYSDYLESLANDRVVFTGDVFGGELETLYANASAYVLASRVEGLPITVCEAMAHSRPLLLSDIAENQEVAGDAARYFRCGDTRSLAGELGALLGDDLLRDSLGRAAFVRARDIFNWDRVTDALESLYYRVLGSA